MSGSNGVSSTDSIELRKLCKQYGSGPMILDDVSLTVRQNEFVTVLGASGSGKTTLLMVVAGFEEPTSGHVFVKGRAADGLPPQKRNLGIVFQNYALFPHLTVWKNVEFPLKARGVPRAERVAKVSKILDVVGLAGLAQRRPHQLSGGQQQRTALARALVFEPAALLLDEPLSALDRRLRESLQSEIKDVQARTGASILYVTHDQEEALRLSDRIVVLAHGRIAQIGTPDEIYRHPRSLFVAACLGETNCLPCDAVAGDGSTVRVQYRGGDGRVRLPRGTGARAGTGVVAVRPEDVFFCGDGGEAENTLRGVIRERSFLGSVVRYVVAVGAEDVIIRRPAGEVQPTRVGANGVTIGFQADAGTFFADEAIAASERESDPVG